jgi:hypothetical protein
VTDVLAVLGLAISIVLAVRWLIAQKSGPVMLAVAGFAALALLLGDKSHMIEAMGYARPVSPLLLWVMMEAVSRKAWRGIVPPLMVSVSAGLAFGSPLVSIVKGVLGYS